MIATRNIGNEWMCAVDRMNTAGNPQQKRHGGKGVSENCHIHYFFTISQNITSCFRKQNNSSLRQMEKWRLIGSLKDIWGWLRRSTSETWISTPVRSANASWKLRLFKVLGLKNTWKVKPLNTIQFRCIDLRSDLKQHVFMWLTMNSG